MTAWRLDSAIDLDLSDQLAGSTEVASIPARAMAAVRLVTFAEASGLSPNPPYSSRARVSHR